jgi:hypothetical protein
MTEARWASVIARYYRSPAVRARIAEYCGGLLDAPETFTCWRLAAYGGREGRTEADGGPVPCEKPDLNRILAEGADVCRSLADRRGTLLQIDVDYVDPHDAGDAYQRPDPTFHCLEPVYLTLLELFGVYGIHPSVIVTGRGYHFTVRAPLGSPAHSALAGIAVLSNAIVGKGTPDGLDLATARLLALAHEGAGRVLEHLAHCALHRLRGRTEVPVTLADLPPEGRGPFICLDLTAYADPLFERYSRCAFSTNQKAGVQGAAPQRPFVMALPRGEEPLAALLRCREDVLAAAVLAATAHATIPDVSDVSDLVEDYRHGPVGRFHADFDRGPELDRVHWPFTYDSLGTSDLPACIAGPLEHPNPLLLRPGCLRTVAFGLWSMGWHPRSIAGLVRSRYEQDHGWQPSFARYDAASRAQFYVRLFCAALVDGLDSGKDFTCKSQVLRGLCEPERCTEEGRCLFALLGPALEEKGRH